MKAWQLIAPGPVSQQLQLTDTAPKPSADSLKGQEILVKVKAAGINPADYKVPEMGMIARAVLPFPYTLAMDVSGEVIATGPEASDVKVGDKVVVRLDPVKTGGALSEYVVAERNGYAVLGSKTGFDCAAGLGTAGLTAYQTIQPYVKAGDHIFINGGSGGVGTLAIQVGKLLGCHVTTSCSTPKVDMCKELGADLVIDYRKSDVIEELKKTGHSYSLVVDLVGTSPQNLHVAAGDVMTKGGVYVLVSTAPTLGSIAHVAGALFKPAFLGGARNKVVVYLTWNDHGHMVQLAQWLDDGKLKVTIDKTYEFDEAKDAYEQLRSGSTAGKIVVHVS